ncbi:hypothetical protein [Streptomyces sp. NBC_00829]|uniref:hypothetical protein n=1 Tax=Streptomyces sp. NBC_00829 TaxID=2903679 RepID=UPI0038632EDE|nr:hypothetical protein OG293_24420 [Streptomyces sp. NBC_00829]
MNRLRGAGSYREDEFFDHLHRGECRFGVDVSGDVIDEFDEEELAEISEKIGELGAVLIEYPSVACIRELLMDVLSGISGILDTNHGELLDYQSALLIFQRDPSWDWRSGGDEIISVANS